MITQLEQLEKAVNLPEGEEQKDILVNISHLNWPQMLPLIPKNGSGLEIGCYKGDTSLWLLKNGLKYLTVIDPIYPTKLSNNTRVFIETGESCRKLVEILYRKQRFNFIYIDGSHTAKDVMLDACMSFTTLTVGGIMVFDDYLFAQNGETCKESIDFFLKLYEKNIQLIYKNQQVAIRRIL